MERRLILLFAVICITVFTSCHQNKTDVINPVNNLSTADTNSYKAYITSNKDEYKTGETAVFIIEFSASKRVSTKIIATFPDSGTEIQIDKVSDTQHKYTTPPFVTPGRKTLSVAFYDADKLNELQKKKEDLQAAIDALNKKQYVFKDKSVEEQLNIYKQELDKTQKEIAEQKPVVTAQKTISVKEEVTIPPDPAALAAIDENQITPSNGISVDFLYSGTNAIQTGVSSTTIERDRVAVIRGKVLDKNSEAVSGVEIRILSHPEYGKTVSRADGMFDMAVNGGGNLTVIYTKKGYLPVQRSINTPWQDFVNIAEVVLTKLDEKSTNIDMSSIQGLAVAAGNEVSDKDGKRKATLLLPQGTEVEMLMPDGSKKQLSKVNIRATEYTVGSNGPNAMPAALPPSSGYTYCLEYSVDEALNAGASDIRFSKPLYHYNENFLNFPTGEIVPSGYYDKTKGCWVASENGRIIKVLNVINGKAELAVINDTTTATMEELNELNVTNEELLKLGSLYMPGTSLWRVPITHFTPWDLNWPYGFPPGAYSPGGSKSGSSGGGSGNNGGGSDGGSGSGDGGGGTGGEGSGGGNGGDGDGGSDGSDGADDGGGAGDDDGGGGNDDCSDSGNSVIEYQSQILGENIPLIGTSFSLNYNSGNVPGYKNHRIWDLKLTGKSFPASMLSVILNIDAMGKHTSVRYTPAPDLKYTFEWDGKDAYNRVINGNRVVNVEIGYMYPLIALSANDVEKSFGMIGDTPMSAARGDSTGILWLRLKSNMENMDTRVFGFGGWTLDIHHYYDVSGRMLYAGNGNQIKMITDLSVVNTIAGKKNSSYRNGAYSGDGGSALKAELNNPQGVACATDGSVYFCDKDNYVVRKISKGGIITTVAGTGDKGYSGDGGPAMQAKLSNPSETVISDDNDIYILDGLRIRKVDKNGIITTFAGKTEGAEKNIQDCDNAVDSYFIDIRDIALSKDGELYVADGLAVYRIGKDGKIRVVHKGSNPTSLSVADDGSVYFYDYLGKVIRKLGPDGNLTIYAGRENNAGSSGDGGPATDATIGEVIDMDIAKNGSLIFAEHYYYVGRIRKVNANGVITTIAGPGYWGSGRDDTDNILASRARAWTYGIAVNAEGAVYLCDVNNNRVRIINPFMAGKSSDDIFIASQDGVEVYRFNKNGRHESTMDAATLKEKYNFSYNAAGFLESITNDSGEKTVIERSENGAPVSVVGPYGAKTFLKLNRDGYLSTVTGPDNGVYSLDYKEGGLLKSFKKPRGNTSTFSYDDRGLLIRDENDVGGYISLERKKLNDGFVIEKNTAENRKATYKRENSDSGDRINKIKGCCGGEIISVSKSDGTQKITRPDGTIVQTVQDADPRFGMQSPIDSEILIITPAGLRYSEKFERNVTVSGSGSMLNPFTQSDILRINGRRYDTVISSADKTIISETPEGRKNVIWFDDLGRVGCSRSYALQASSYTYDSSGRLTGISRGVRESSIFYEKGNVKKTINSLGLVTSFEYDRANRIVKRILPDQREINYTYDANGNLTSITPPSHPVHSFEYNSVDLRSRYSPPSNESTKYEYNLDKDVSKIARPDGKGITFSYNNSGKISTISTLASKTTYNYDPVTGNLDNVALDTGKVETISYLYDGSLVTSIGSAGTVNGTIEKYYDNNFWISSITINGQAPVNFRYDQDGLVVKSGDLTFHRDDKNALINESYIENVHEYFAYNPFAEITSYRAEYNYNTIYKTECTRDNAGRIVSSTETVNGVKTVIDYKYDTLGRLVKVTKDEGRGAKDETFYTYDPNGNRLLKNVSFPSGSIGNPEVVNATYDEQDRLLSYGNKTYTYTPNGELKFSALNAERSTLYDYDEFGNLRSVTLPDGRTIEYVTDPKNRRIGKKVNGMLVKGWLYSDGLLPVAELDGSGNVVSQFFGNVIYKGDKKYKIITNYIGSPRLVVDSQTGEIVQEIEYDEFGQVLNDTNPGFQPFGFAGGLYDPDTKLVRFGARDYDPETGRWTSKDPIDFAGGDTNLYGYCLNDPVNFVDKNGLFIIDPLAVGIGALIGLADQGLNDIINGELSGFSDYTGSALGGGLAGLLAANGFPFFGAEAGSTFKNSFKSWFDPCYDWDDALRDSLIDSIFNGLKTTKTGKSKIGNGLLGGLNQFMGTLW